MSFWPKHRPQPVDLADAEEGKALFLHEWKVNDPLSGGDGIGPVFNATSCVACHNQGGVGGGGGLEHNVTNYISQPGGVGPIRQGVIHTHATDPSYQETLRDIDPSLPAISTPTLASILPERNAAKQGGKLGLPHGVHISQRNTPALFGAKLIDDLPDSAIIAVERMQKVRWGGADAETMPLGRAMRLKDGKIGKFGWKAQSPSLIDFVEAACANELGLSNPGQAQPLPKQGSPAFPKGMPYRTMATGTDLTTKQCQQMTAFIGTLPQPVQLIPDNERDLGRVENGKKAFKSAGCADCHVPDVGSIQGIYSDLLMHKMGRDLEGIGGYNAPPQQPDSPDGTTPDEWRTPPLWGVADSAPYLHDGRAATLEEAIAAHGGQAQQSAQRFLKLDGRDRNDVIFFLNSLKAPQVAHVRP
jgi:CxxC motif-containing protein (DUF1111 family)